jgi:hypothetical protein
LEQRFGRQAVLECIEHTLARCGVFHFEVVEPSAGDKEPSARDRESSAGYKELAAQRIEVIAHADYSELMRSRSEL